VKDLWRNFNIKRVVHNIGDTWSEVLQSFMNGVSRNMWPDVVTDFNGFDPEEEIDSSRHAIVGISRTDLQHVFEASLEELLQSHMEFSNENLLELEKYNYMVNGEDDESPHVNPVKYVSTKLLT
jgi:hypothetical protein